MPESINNPEITRHANESLRPLAEQAISFVASLELVMPEAQRLLPLVPNDETLIEDGREAEGVSRLTGADIHAAVGISQAITAIATPEARALLAKISVRPVRIQS